MENIITIEFQYFIGCPNVPILLKNFKDAIAGYEDRIVFTEQLIDSPELARKYSFRGSPTLLIDGNDIEGMPAPENPSLACRFYQNGIPTKDFIRNLILSKLSN